jgi:hypothetical protein
VIKPFGNSSSRIEPRRFCLGGDSSGFALDDLDSSVDSNLYSPTVPAPRCTSQPLPHLLRLLLMYQANRFHASPSRRFFFALDACPADTAFWPIFRVFSGWKPPTSVGGERSEKGRAALQGRVKDREKIVPRAAGSRAAQRSAHSRTNAATTVEFSKMSSALFALRSELSLSLAFCLFVYCLRLRRI